MDKADQIWNEIKNDKTKIYENQTMFDVFLATIDNLKPEHFMELSPKDRNKVNENVVYRLIRFADNTKILEFIGRENINRLPSNYVGHLLNAAAKSEVHEMSGVSTIQGMVEFLGKHHVDKLNGSSVFPILNNAENKIEAAEILGRQNIDKLSGTQVFNLLVEFIYDGYQSRSVVIKKLKEMIKILGTENLNKLSGSHVDHLIRGLSSPRFHGINPSEQELEGLFGRENLDKTKDLI